VIGASTAGLLGAPLGQGPLLAATALDPDRPGVKKDQPPIVALEEALAVSVARAVLEDTTPPQTTLGLLLSGIRKPDPEQAVGGNLYNLFGALIERAQYTAFRGVLALEVGDLDKAEQLFRESLRLWRPYPDKPNFLGVDFQYRVMAEEYLEKLRKHK